jgi:hypothetical protein
VYHKNVFTIFSKKIKKFFKAPFSDKKKRASRLSSKYDFEGHWVCALINQRYALFCKSPQVLPQSLQKVSS